MEQQRNHNYTITTPRLYLRGGGLADLHTFHELRQDETVMAYIAKAVAVDISKTIEWIESRYAPGTLSFAIELRQPREQSSDNKPEMIGDVGIQKQEGIVIGGISMFEPPMVGYALSQKFRHQGYATEALGGFLKWYWEKFPTGPKNVKEGENNMLLAIVHQDNTPSANVLKRCGFKYWKGLEVEDWHTGEPIQLQHYRLERPDTASMPINDD